jgi:hypothetical protein
LQSKVREVSTSQSAALDVVSVVLRTTAEVSVSIVSVASDPFDSLKLRWWQWDWLPRMTQSVQVPQGHFLPTSEVDLEIPVDSTLSLRAIRVTSEHLQEMVTTRQTLGVKLVVLVVPLTIEGHGFSVKKHHASEGVVGWEPDIERGVSVGRKVDSVVESNVLRDSSFTIVLVRDARQTIEVRHTVTKR